MGLKGIPTIISPELLKTLAEMGHGDMIVLADAHFPGQSIGAKNNVKVIREDGIKSIPNLLDAVLQLIELDTYIPTLGFLMKLTIEDREKQIQPPNWPIYSQSLKKSRKNIDTEPSVQLVERFEFYKQASQAYVIVMTGDTSVYGNIIITKGVTHGV